VRQLADVTSSGIGGLLSRVKYAEGTPSKLFESSTANLASLLRLWTDVVTQRFLLNLSR